MSTPLQEAPSPWLNLQVSIYMLPFTTSAPLLDHAYSPLEAESSFASPASGTFKGGLGTIQIVRYHDSPVGSYDELLIIPGKFEVPGVKKDMLRMTRIYVSQKATCYNGRKNWNVPKHLARFSFSESGKTSQLEVFPPDDPKAPAFFKARLTPFKYLPAIPFSTNTSKYVGMDLRLVQPPLPAAKSSEQEDLKYVCGTDEWKVGVPEIWGGAKCCWADVQPTPGKATEQSPLLETANGAGADGALDTETFRWPAYKPWSIGLFIEHGKMNFSEGHVDGLRGG